MAKSAEQSDENFAYPSGTAFFKSNIAGLTVHLSYDEENDKEPGTVRFQPYAFNDQRTGTNYVVGYLATNDDEAIEKCQKDSNVTEITEDEYNKDIQEGILTRY